MNLTEINLENPTEENKSNDINAVNNINNYQNQSNEYYQQPYINNIPKQPISSEDKIAMAYQKLLYQKQQEEYYKQFYGVNKQTQYEYNIQNNSNNEITPQNLFENPDLYKPVEAGYLGENFKEKIVPIKAEEIENEKTKNTFSIVNIIIVFAGVIIVCLMFALFSKYF